METTKELKPHQQRVVDEKTQLDDRLAKLTAFIETNPIWDNVEPFEQKRLVKQAGIMREYSQVLAERIQAF